HRGGFSSFLAQIYPEWGLHTRFSWSVSLHLFKGFGAMAEWRKLKLSKEEEEGIEAVESEECGEEFFDRSLVGKLWTVDPFNVRIFKQVITQAWRLKNTVEVQDLNKNLFLFRFASKRDADSVMKNGPWSFDRNLVVLKRISGEEQPSDLEMHTGEFWTRIYDLPLKLRSESMAKKLGDIIGSFMEVDSKDCNRLGKFLRVKTSIDLRKPLKRGTIVKYQGKDLKVFFKFERLPTFCFVCGRIGHQIKDCEELESKDDADFDDIEEKELPFGQWLRASPLPKFTGEFKKENSSGSCSKSLFSEPSTNRKASTEDKEKGEVEQPVVSPVMLMSATPEAAVGAEKPHSAVESVAESLGNVAISTPILGQFDKGSNTKPKSAVTVKKKWARKNTTRKPKIQKEVIVAELGKRNLVEVTIAEGDPMELCGGEQKRRHTVKKVVSIVPEGVLVDQHLLSQ
ncbi:zinc CCHC-type-like protein, partial [Trifolium medium]|nr:zinc CCHC-type-like protein [Trifolium medium]